MAGMYTQRQAAVAAALGALLEEGFVFGWRRVWGYGGGRIWEVDGRAPMTTAEVECFIRGARMVLVDPRVRRMLRDAAVAA